MTAAANLNITVIEPRMYRLTQAAAYCGISVRKFKAHYPHAATEMAEGDLRYDKRDLDLWIESKKAGAMSGGIDEILERL